MKYDFVVVGLGNPGQRYEGTRHNAGFSIISAVLRLAQRDGRLQDLNGGKFSCGLWGVALPDKKHNLLCATPLTFMNESGRCVQPLLHWHKISPAQLIVAHDEMDIPPGQLRFKRGGGNAGHNGLKSITALLGTPDFYRLRIGIGHPPRRNDVINWVLGHPDTNDAMAIQHAIEAGVDVLLTFFGRGLEAATAQARAFSPVQSPAGKK